MLCPIFSIQDGLKANDEKEKKNWARGATAKRKDNWHPSINPLKYTDILNTEHVFALMYFTYIAKS